MLSILRAAEIKAKDAYLDAHRKWFALRFSPFDVQHPAEQAMHETRLAYFRATAAVEKAERAERLTAQCSRCTTPVFPGVIVCAQCDRAPYPNYCGD